MHRICISSILLDASVNFRAGDKILPTTFRVAAISLFALTLAGCAVKGNDTGGIIAWSPENHYAAPELAAQHCARWDKVAVKTGEVADYGNFISFRCKWNPRRP